MKCCLNHLKYWAFACLLLLSVGASGAKYTDNTLLIVGLDADYAPLEYVDDNGMAHGYDVEFTNELMKRLGIKFTYAPNKWENIAGDVLSGRVDLAMMIYSSYRKDSTNYSRAVFRLYYQVVYRIPEGKTASDATFDFRNLKGKRIAFMNSRPINIMLKDEQAIAHQVTNLSKAMTDLSNGQYDAVICFRYQAHYFLTRYDHLSNLKAEDLSLQPREYCYVSHDKSLINTINKELILMEEEGIIDDIYGKDIKSQFGAITIPEWVWMLLASLIALFLFAMVLIYHHSNQKLVAEHQKLEQKNKELLVANDRAKESSRMKTIFIQQISHEIRTPLNTLNGFSQILTTSEMELTQEEKEDIGQRIEASTERITELVNKMLDLSDVISQNAVELKDDVTASELAQMAIDDSGISQVSHISFEFSMDASCQSLQFTTNRQQAVRALSMLLDNAQKFTNAGHALLRVEKQTADFISFIVEDTGIGIPPEKAEHIFEPFVQLDDYYDGTGIGLTVARSIVRRLGGDVVLDTARYTTTSATASATGSRFIMTLPVAAKPAG